MFSKTAAMSAIKRKKMHTNHLSSTQSQIATLEQQMHAVETANLNVETLKVMKSASNAMKVIHGGMNVDKVDETMYVPLFSLSYMHGHYLGSGMLGHRIWTGQILSIKRADSSFSLAPNRSLTIISCTL